MYCGNCGKEVGAEWDFCMNCGAKISIQREIDVRPNATAGMGQQVISPAYQATSPTQQAGSVRGTMASYSIGNSSLPVIALVCWVGMLLFSIVYVGYSFNRFYFNFFFYVSPDYIDAVYGGNYYIYISAIGLGIVSALALIIFTIVSIKIGRMKLMLLPMMIYMTTLLAQELLQIGRIELNWLVLVWIALVGGISLLYFIGHRSKLGLRVVFISGICCALIYPISIVVFNQLYLRMWIDDIGYIRAVGTLLLNSNNLMIPLFFCGVAFLSLQTLKRLREVVVRPNAGVEQQAVSPAQQASSAGTTITKQKKEN